MVAHGESDTGMSLDRLGTLSLPNGQPVVVGALALEAAATSVKSIIGNKRVHLEEPVKIVNGFSARNAS